MQPRSSTSDTTSLLNRTPHRPLRQHSTLAMERRAELAAAFGSDDDDDDDDDNNGRRVDTELTSSNNHSRRSISQEAFFDAGEALQSDPLNAQQANQPIHASYGNAPPYTPVLGSRTPRLGGEAGQPEAYNFEDASYFTPTRPRASRTSSVAVSRVASPGTHGRMEASNGVMPGVRSNDAAPSSITRMRIALGRFGRLVGMRVPGATYSSLNTDDDGNAVLPRSSVRGVMGSGIGQDGVFANMNAKPERRRRRGEDGEDRGDDDDLVDDVLPPTYETAAADTAPPYWETTIIGGPGGLHPLAPGGMGWTPGGANVGAIEDLIVDGLPVGNFFGFAWNLLVSMSFQFVGFLLTYLLHTTHAARCGSRAGLGITLVQYGFYLRTRALQIAEGKLPDDGLSPLPGTIDDGSGNSAGHSVWWSPKPSNVGEEESRSAEWVQRGILVLRQTISSASNSTMRGSNGTLADALAADNTVTIPGVDGISSESMGASTEYLAYILMGIGWFILLSSALSYYRVHRWGRQLVNAARRESERDETTADATTSNAETPVGFLHAMRRAFGNSRRLSNRREHSAEDWVIFPGRHRAPPEAEAEPDSETTNLTSNDERLLQSMRNVGLLA
jgi:hypothetical protein